MPNSHRKRLQHFNDPGHLHFLTFSCYQRLPLLTNDLAREWLARALDRACERHQMQLGGFVFMPEHVHLLLWPQTAEYRMNTFLFSLKRPFSFRMKEHLVKIKSPLVDKLTLRTRPDVQAFRFWQEGGGYDRNLFSETYIRQTLDYMHANPVKRGMVSSPDRWRWSSWHAYQNPQQHDSLLPTVNILPF